MIKDGIIFDFDGTLADTSEGVLGGVEYALRSLKVDVPEKSVLKEFIGPTLYESFTRVTGLSHADAERAIELYREFYVPRGVYMLKAYDGIGEMLAELKERGVKLSVASSKPYYQLKLAVEALGFTSLFDKITGADPTERHSKKSMLFKEARLAANSIVVGDSVFDIVGAHEAGLPVIALTYGFGKQDEIAAAGPEYTAASVAELKKILIEE